MPESKLILQRWHPLARLALFALVHGTITWLGLYFAAQKAHVSAVWPSSGVALTALLLSRARHWPALVLVAIAVEVAVYYPGHLPLPYTVAICTGNSLEALTGAWLLRRHAGFRPSLERVRDVLALGGLAVMLSTLVGATPTALLLVLHGKIAWPDLGSHWRVFWMSDAMGVLLVAPLLLTWATRGLEGWSRARLLELATLLLVLGLLMSAFFHWAPLDASAYHPASYLAFPFILWAALRFEARGTAAALAVLAAVVLSHTLVGSGPFARGLKGLDIHGARLVLLQSFLAAAGISGLLLAAALSERRRAQETVSNLNHQLRQSLDALATTQQELVRRERLAALGELAASVAHEVRNPLAAMSNSVASLTQRASPEDDPVSWGLLGVMGEEIARLDHLINGLLDFARPVEPRLFFQSLGSVVEEALEVSLRSRSRPEQLQVTCTLEALPDIPLDAQLLHLALSNLFINALQAMPQGGSLQVELRREVREGQPLACLAITDTGTGITPEVMGRMFEPFYTTKASGTGLGLAIVRRIIEAHHGEVRVRSTLGQGTTFHVHLPLGQSPRATAAA
jgi:signal transduction histidine kinase